MSCSKGEHFGKQLRLFLKHKIFCNDFTSILNDYQIIQGPTAAAAAVPVRESLRAGSPAPTIYPNKGILDLGFEII